MPSEDERLSIVGELTVTDPSPDPESDELIRYVARVCNAPHAVLALIGRSRLWFKSRLGVDCSEMAKLALPPDLEVIEDAARDPRGPGNPLLALAPGARFLAVAPLRDERIEVGLLAIMDRKARTLAPHQVDALRSAATQAVGMLKLRRRVRLLEALLESSPDQFYAFDPGGRYIYASERGARAMGLDSARMMGRTWQELGWDPKYTAQFHGMLRLALTTGQLVEDARSASTPGGFVHHEYALAPVRRRDDVLAVVSHDLRNILNVFRLTTSSLATELEDEAGTAGDFVAVLQRQADSMSRLVDDLLDVARIDAGSLRVVRSGCDVSALAQDALLAVQPLAQQKGITLEAHLPEPSVPVHCDRRRILQVFANLMGNAVKFTGKGGVRLEVSLEGREVCFSISDTGAGISPEHLPHLFERYWQAREGERSGAGLGLYIARGIVEAHGGRIWADSTRGKGTRISFTLLRPA